MTLRRFLVVVVALFAACPLSRAADFVWIEGEKPTSSNFKVAGNGWGNKHFLSGDQWLHISGAEDKVGKDVPAEGILLGYDFTADKEGKHEVWDRIGFEFV